MQTYSSYSALQARAILCALQTNDRGLLQQELKRVDGRANLYDAAEAERMELLSEIARELQMEAEPFASSTANLFWDLLTHLAATPKNLRQRPATSWALGSRSVPAAALLQ